MNFLPSSSSATYHPSNHPPRRRKPKLDSQPDPEWTAVDSTDLHSSSDFESISDSELPARLANPAATNRVGPSSSIHSRPSLSTSVYNPLEDLNRLLVPLRNSDPESDSSTSFDAQAWKRGHHGTTHHPPDPLPSAHIYHPVHEPSSASPAPWSHSTDEGARRRARIHSTPQVFSTSHRVLSNEIRPSTSLTSNPALRPFLASTSLPNSQASSSTLVNNSRPGLSYPGRSTAPTWRPYTSLRALRQDLKRDEESVEDEEVDGHEEFLAALANLRAMSIRRKPAVWASSDGEADDAWPRHADMPTSPLNSAVDEDEPQGPGHSARDSDDEDGMVWPKLSKWWDCLGDSITLKTWQIVGISGLVLGIGIGAG